MQDVIRPMYTKNSRTLKGDFYFFLAPSGSLYVVFEIRQMKSQSIFKHLNRRL